MASSPPWTVWDVAAHLATVVSRYRDGPEGRGRWVDDPTDLAGLNEAQRRQLAGLELADLAQCICGEVDALVRQIDAYGDEQPSFRFHGGGMVRADQALGILAGEFLVHGWDIARALRQRWPMPAPDVAVTLHGLAPILPGWVNPRRYRAHTATYDVHLRRAARQAWRFHNGRLEIDPEPTVHHADCHLYGSPGAVLLVMYRRRSPWWAAATGQTVAWGRRPWLAFGLADRFYRP